MEGQEIHCEGVHSLHEDWLALFTIQEKIRVLQEWKLMLEDRQTIYAKMIGSHDINPEKLLKLQTEKTYWQPTSSTYIAQAACVTLPL